MRGIDGSSRVRAKDWKVDVTISLGGLFLSSFLAATLLPGGSEIVFAAVLVGGAGLWPALIVATVGNTLGGSSSYLVGRLVPDRALHGRALEWLRHWGSPALLLSWVPIIGDALCVAAGWLRLNLWWSVLFMALGKFGRYYLIARLMA